jgi:DNA-binding MarR family transcriptional regulator
VGKTARSPQAAGRDRRAAASHPSSAEKTALAKGPLALDRLIHERLRLGIVSALAANERLTFNELKHLLQTTDGNLSVHARKLEAANYVACEKTFAGRVPRSVYRLTASGRRALDKYLVHMEAIIQAAVRPTDSNAAGSADTSRSRGRRAWDRR